MKIIIRHTPLKTSFQINLEQTHLPIVISYVAGYDRPVIVGWIEWIDLRPETQVLSEHRQYSKPWFWYFKSEKHVGGKNYFRYFLPKVPVCRIMKVPKISQKWSKKAM